MGVWDSCACGSRKQKRSVRCANCKPLYPSKVNPKRHQVSQPSDPTIRLIALTQNKNAIVDAEDFERLSLFNWFAHKTQRGTYYAERALPGGRQARMGHDILNLPSNVIVDHKNRNTLDYRKCNLREATYNQNAQNSKPRNPQSGYKGVSRNPDSERLKWRAQIVFNRVKIYLGSFRTKEEAYEAWKAKAIELHGDFACLE